MNPYRQQRLEELRPYVERAQRMEGWTFDVSTVRIGAETPWSYPDRARELLSGVDAVLDMGTGGGERFSDISRSYAGLAVATEEWPPNVLVAAKRLVPMGIAVVHSSSLHLPFHDSVFGLVLNRHEHLDPWEVARVLVPGGHIFTQQAGGGDSWKEIRRFFPQMTDFGNLLEQYREGLRAAGLSIVRAETHGYGVAYQSLGDLVYVIAVAPWAIPDFDLDRDINALLALERDLGTEQGIVLSESRFIIEAVKGG